MDLHRYYFKMIVFKLIFALKNINFFIYNINFSNNANKSIKFEEAK